MSLLAGFAGAQQALGYQDYAKAVAQQQTYNVPVQEKRKLEIILDNIRVLTERAGQTENKLDALADRVMGSIANGTNPIPSQPPHCCILDEINGALQMLEGFLDRATNHAARLSTLA